MRQLFTHTLQQPFIFSTGLAALVHSTWSVSTLFTGQEPFPQFSFSWFAWILPGFLIAFSLDVGQIVTSSEIRQGDRTWQKYATFGIFAIATWYLQFLYIAHHMPHLELATGVAHATLATGLRDLALWILPALLPLSTLLYTFSHSKHYPQEIEQPQKNNIEEHYIEEHDTEKLLIPLEQPDLVRENGSAPVVADSH